ncbi:hypothetical protein DPX16_20353 [Anabarilius grahami]|uniref:Uncharacterized protein n=1 Tax=Anabarilius grahami TaxID=495550 RepID=A0A3N0XI16_ANAGA|nr:hypothetical protein DPX16_20353 [Anabarilius grahami]
MSPIIVALIGRECFRDHICSNSGKTSLFAKGELQKSCSRTTVAPLEGSCQLPCQCRPYPPLPPPPPPPPPPRLLAPTAQCRWQMSGIVVECQESRSGSTTSPPLNGQDVLAGLALHQAPSFN